MRTHAALGASFYHDATRYSQNRPSHEILRRILGLETVARVLVGQTQLQKLRAVARLPYHSGDFWAIARIEVDICSFCATVLAIDYNVLSCNESNMFMEA